jgi:hypothetical protein
MTVSKLAAALVGEVLIYVQAVGLVLGLLGRWSDVEGNLLFAGILVTIPGAGLFGVAIGRYYARMVTTRPHAQNRLLIGLYGLNAVLLLLSQMLEASAAFR